MCAKEDEPSSAISIPQESDLCDNFHWKIYWKKTWNEDEISSNDITNHMQVSDFLISARSKNNTRG